MKTVVVTGAGMNKTVICAAFGRTEVNCAKVGRAKVERGRVEGAGVAGPQLTAKVVLGASVYFENAFVGVGMSRLWLRRKVISNVHVKVLSMHYLIFCLRKRMHLNMLSAAVFLIRPFSIYNAHIFLLPPKSLLQLLSSP